MSSKLKINKDFKSRLSVIQIKNIYRLNKILLNDLYIPTENRQFLLMNNKNKKLLIRSKVRNRCLITGRARSVHSYIKLTRMMFKNLAVKGNLAGIKKYSW
jgi:ribosomal protein S14